MRISDWSSDVCSSDLWTHGGKIPLQPFPDRLALAAQPVMLTLAALLCQPGVERIPCRKPRDRHHEVAPGITDQPLDVPLVVALSRTAIAIPDQVVGQEATEQCRTLACPVGQDLRHKAAVIVVDRRSVV